MSCKDILESMMKKNKNIDVLFEEKEIEKKK